MVLSAGGGGGGGGGGGCRRRDLERRGGGGRGAPCLATISSSVAGSAGGCGSVVGLPSYKKRQGIFFNPKKINVIFTNFYSSNYLQCDIFYIFLILPMKREN